MRAVRSAGRCSGREREKQKQCQHVLTLATSLLPQRRTGNDHDEPHGIDGDVVRRELHEEAAVGHAAVARKGVERARVGVRRGRDDLSTCARSESA